MSAVDRGIYILIAVGDRTFLSLASLVMGSLAQALMSCGAEDR